MVEHCSVFVEIIPAQTYLFIRPSMLITPLNIRKTRGLRGFLGVLDSFPESKGGGQY